MRQKQSGLLGSDEEEEERSASIAFSLLEEDIYMVFFVW
jgi:hypothetical protein